MYIFTRFFTATRQWSLCFGWILFFLFNLTGLVFAQSQNAYVTPGGIKFLLYTPPNYVASPALAFPMLMVLHGGGEIGDDLTELTTQTPHQIPSKLISTGQWPSSRPFIVVSPQLKRDLSIPNKNDQEWSADSVDAVVEYVRSLWRVDATQIYITGISLGGAGAWTYAAAHPNKVAAVVPISGKTDVTQACRLKDIPVWAFHGENDALVPNRFTTDMVAAVNQCQGRYQAHLNLLYSRPHEGWSEVYNLTNGYDVYAWMLQFKKGSATNAVPIVSAGTDKKIALRAGPFYLAGECFDPEGALTQVQWTQLSGPTVTLSGVNDKILRIQNLVAGTYQFQLQATDQAGASASDVVQLQVVVPTTEAVVTGIILTDANEQNLRPLVEDDVINTSLLGTDDFNMLATTTGTIGSVRFQVSSDQNTRTVNGSDPYYITRANTKWTMSPGRLVVCATPYSLTGGRGTPGITQCYHITVTDQVVTPIVFYARPQTDLSQLTSWNSQADGSGIPPVSFNLPGQTFYVRTTASINQSLAIGGANSAMIVEDGAQLTIAAGLSGSITLTGTAQVNVNTNAVITWSSIGVNTTINWMSAATQIPAGIYGHVSMQGTATVKQLASSDTEIRGQLIVYPQVSLQGHADGSSRLLLSGDLTVQGTTDLLPPIPFAVHFVRSGEQQVNLGPSAVRFGAWHIASGTTVSLSPQTSSKTITLGHAAGGGLLIENSGSLTLGRHTLAITGQGTLNAGNQTGTIACRHGDLNIQSTASEPSHLYLLSGADTLTNLSMTLPVAGALHLNTHVKVAGVVSCGQGTLYTHDQLTLLSTPTRTAALGPLASGAVLSGEIYFQQVVRPGRLYRYLSLPLIDAKVSDLQPYIPITGKFNGSSTGPGLSSNPSAFEYDEAGGGWLPFPTASNQEIFGVGKGYAIYTRHVAGPLRFQVLGTPVQGTFAFTLRGDPDVTSQTDGWNLLGNPYACPVQWGTTGWSSNGVSNTVYVRDNHFPGGRFLVWDGEAGDEEFGGLLSAGQAFWVRSTTATPQLSVSENAKVLMSGTLLRRSPARMLTVALWQDSLVDRTYIRFDAKAQNGFESQYDAVKQYNGYFNISTRSSDGVPLAINRMGNRFCEQTIPLDLSVKSPGLYRVVIDPGRLVNEGWEVFLVDHLLDSVVAVTGITPYTMSIARDGVQDTGRLTIQINQQTIPLCRWTGTVLMSDHAEGNQWMRNGQVVPGAIGQEYIPRTSGVYQVRIEKGGCQRYSAPVTVTLSNDEKQSPWRVYPNPVDDILTIQCSRPAPFEFSLQDLAGRRLQQGSCETASCAVSVKDLSPGIYILLLEGNGQVVRHRISVQ